MKKTFVIDGNNFLDLGGFYDEVQKVLTDNFKDFGRNMHAFNDILRGGFGKFEYDEPIKIIWKNSQKSKKDLGFPETVKYIKNDRLETFPPFLKSVKESKKKDLEDAKKHKGDALFQIIIKIISGNKNVELVLY